VNMKNTELLKINCEKKNSGSEALNIKLVKSKIPSACCRLIAECLPCVVGGIGHYFFSIRRYLHPELNCFAVQFVEWI
jgi:hypothetical protein